ncbi:hypothetical protein NX794_28025 [Streptomyces sp. LP11]|uniref:Integral membrane protein n=1 Tax=Streptomyces pyxinicus TaxID=2970331 RepID=A0ABT2BAR8_9ACTN|nr:hypothetical protein [Streptomyces sp. LP11]MCS0605028.1 hypothetical protein [Streptomyces sp. LP11]
MAGDLARRGTEERASGGVDRPGTPSAAGAWDARSGEWLGDDPADLGVPPSAPAGPGSEAVPSAAEVLLSALSDLTDDAGPSAVSRGALPAPAADPGTAPLTDPRQGRKRAPSPRRLPGDPVKTLLHRHRDLCERAVDPLEIAAGLEAHGVTDRTAARFRHRDVFSLAEELYARVPRDGDARPEPDPPPVPRVRAGWALLILLPGALTGATVAALRLAHGHTRQLLVLTGVLAVALATRAALRHGPLSGPRAKHAAGGTRACTLWLLAYALFGDGLLDAVLSGGPDTLPTGVPYGPWPTATAPALALALACAPAAWCAHLLTAGARRRLAGSRGLEDFTSAAKPLLLGTFTLFLGALAALLPLTGTAPREAPAPLALGALLLSARLLTVHQYRHGPALALGAAAATEAAAVALPLAGRLPGCAFLTTPVRTLVDTWGPSAVPALACGTAALALLLHATRTLTRASAHAPTGAPE